jgi:hypothetical protein
MSTLAHLGRIGVRTTPGRAVTDFVVEPMFPPLYEDAGKEQERVAQKKGAQSEQQEQATDPPAPTTPPTAPDPLAQYGWVRGATLEQVRDADGVELAWSEAPPCGHPAFDLDHHSSATDADERITRALTALHGIGRGAGVKIAVIERAWSKLAGDQAHESRSLPDDRWAEAVAEFGAHGDRTFAALHGAPTTPVDVPGVAPEATIGLFSPLAVDPATGDLVDDLAGAVVRAARWLGIEPIGCITQLLRPFVALVPGLERGLWPTPRGVLLVEMQHFLMEPQVRDLDADARERWCPGGRAAAGPVDADPAIRAAIAEVTRAGHLAVVPAANGRRDLRQVQDDVALGAPTLSPRLDSDGHTALRVGACHALGRVAGSNFGAGAVEVCAPGHAVRTAVVQGGAWTEGRWGGTSAASTLIAGVAACLATAHPMGVVRRMLTTGSAVPDLGTRPSWFD